MLIAESATFLRVPGTKSIDRRFVERVCDLVRDILREDFWNEAREGPNQSQAEKVLHISQPQLSGLYNRKPGKGVGLPVVLALREYVGGTVDAILGLPPTAGRRPKKATADLIAAADLEIAAKREEIRSAPERVDVSAQRARAQEKKAKEGRKRWRGRLKKKKAEQQVAGRRHGADGRPSHTKKAAG